MANIYIGADHGGFQLKEQLKSWLQNTWPNLKTIDLGAKELVPDDDYPLIAIEVGKNVATQPDNFGVLFCRSGAGMAIAANKIEGVRAAVGYSKQAAAHAREHDDANIITIASDWLTEAEVKEIITDFINTKFAGGRHARRVAQIANIERQNI